MPVSYTHLDVYKRQDLDGNFSLNVSKKGVSLTVSFMGYTPKDGVVKDKTMNITLEENSKLLDEVVVVGYGAGKIIVDGYYVNAFSGKSVEVSGQCCDEGFAFARFHLGKDVYKRQI